MKQWVRRALTTAAMLAALFAPASAQDWPAKPVRIVVTFAPGGAADVWARLIAEPLSAALKQSVVIENRGGPAGRPR
jgi:tripartite-type tricarboxylate transporter receptor subunit TctC